MASKNDQFVSRSKKRRKMFQKNSIPEYFGVLEKHENAFYHNVFGLKNCPKRVLTRDRSFGIRVCPFSVCQNKKGDAQPKKGPRSHKLRTTDLQPSDIVK